MEWSGLLQLALGGVLTALVLAWFARLARRKGAVPDRDAGRRARPNRVIIAFISGGSLILGGLALYAGILGTGGTAALVVGLPFTTIGFVTLGSLSPALDVVWDGTGLSGPASYGMPPFGPRRARLDYAAIAEAGMDAMGSFYVTDSAGQKIRWNQYYSGHAELAEDIATARPDLFEDHS